MGLEVRMKVRKKVTKKATKAVRMTVKMEDNSRLILAYVFADLT